jgi:hypothetical protein
MKLTQGIFLFSIFVNACAGPVSVEKTEDFSFVETQLIQPKNPGEPWARKISLKESSDIAGWIVEKQNFSDDGQIEEFKSIGVLDSSGEFVDEHIDKNKAVYKIGSKWSTQVLPAVKDLVVDTPALCAQGLGALQIFESFRIVFRLPKHDQRFLLEGCQVQIHSNIFILNNSIDWKNTDPNTAPAEFDLKIVSNEILYDSDIEINLSGKAGENGKPVAKARNGVTPNADRVIEMTTQKYALFHVHLKESNNRALAFGAGRVTQSKFKHFLEKFSPQELIGGDGKAGANANNGQRGGDGGTLLVYSPVKPRFEVNVAGGLGGAPSEPGEGGEGGPPVKIFLKLIASSKDESQKIPIFLGPPGKKGPPGKSGVFGPNGKMGSSLWIPTENTSQTTGIYAENIAQ